MTLAFNRNRTLSIIADEYGDVKAQIASLEKQADELKDELHAIGDELAIGERWTVTRSESTQKRLDTKALRALLGDGLDPYEKESKVARFLVKPTVASHARGWDE